MGIGPAPLEWKRYYNSGDFIGWRFSYSSYLADVNVLTKVMFKDSGAKVNFYLDNGDWLAATADRTTLNWDAANSEWVVVHPNDMTEKYNAAGKLLSRVNRQGLGVTVTYSGNNDRTMTHYSGRTLQLQGAFDRTLTDPAGNVYTYVRTLFDPLLDHPWEYVILPDDTPGNANDNFRIQYLYEVTRQNAPGQIKTRMLTGIIDETGTRYSTYGYDVSRQRAVSSERANGVEKTVVTENGSDIDVTNPLLRESTYEFDYQRLTTVAGHLTASGLCSDTSVTRTYDSNGNIDTKTDENGVVTDYTYNDRGLMEGKTQAFGTSEAVTTTTQWHATHRLPDLITKPGQVIDHEYNADGTLASTTITQ